MGQRVLLLRTVVLTLELVESVVGVKCEIAQARLAEVLELLVELLKFQFFFSYFILCHLTFVFSSALARIASMFSSVTVESLLAKMLCAENVMW